MQPPTSVRRQPWSGWLRNVIRGLRQSDHGQSLVEFSMILPIFLILIFALVDFGRGFYTWQVVTNAAREGARAAAVQSDSATVDAKIRAAYCSNYPSSCSLDSSKMTITKTNIQGARGSEASVDISYAFSYVTPIGSFMKFIGGGSLAAPTISAHSSMRLE